MLFVVSSRGSGPVDEFNHRHSLSSHVKLCPPLEQQRQAGGQSPEEASLESWEQGEPGSICRPSQRGSEKELNPKASIVCKELPFLGI